jgi:long-chain acyl-CoA synthetase
VFGGYWGDEKDTRSCFTDDGWLRTGDVGEIDDEGFVRVTGRQQEILVTAGGKRVAPALLEDLVRSHPLVSQCLVVGDGRPFVAALVTLDAVAAARWAREHGLAADADVLAEDATLTTEIQFAIDTANRSVSQAEAIRRFTVLPQDWTEEDGQLTPGLKIRRTVVTRQHRADIEALYLRRQDASS